MFNLSRPVKHSKERRKRLPISEVISSLKVAGEERLATAVLLRRPAEAKGLVRVNSIKEVGTFHCKIDKYYFVVG